MMCFFVFIVIIFLFCIVVVGLFELVWRNCLLVEVLLFKCGIIVDCNGVLFVFVFLVYVLWYNFKVIIEKGLLLVKLFVVVVVELVKIFLDENVVELMGEFVLGKLGYFCCRIFFEDVNRIYVLGEFVFEFFWENVCFYL